MVDEVRRFSALLISTALGLQSIRIRERTITSRPLPWWPVSDTKAEKGGLVAISYFRTDQVPSEAEPLQCAFDVNGCIIFAPASSRVYGRRIWTEDHEPLLPHPESLNDAAAQARPSGSSAGWPDRGSSPSHSAVRGGGMRSGTELRTRQQDGGPCAGGVGVVAPVGGLVISPPARAARAARAPRW